MTGPRRYTRWLIVGLFLAVAGRPGIRQVQEFCLLLRPPSLLNAQARVPDVPQVPFELYTLPNGLEVILSQDRRLPIVAVNLWYHVGPVNEAPGRTGFAHLFEHMMFQGSKHVPPDSHFRLLQGVGATNVNGTTGFDRTNYFETVPSRQLELALWIESDRMGYLLDTLDATALANQQDVVRNERRQSRESRPYALGEEALTQALVPPGHPYHGDIIGSHQDIQAAQLADVRQFSTLYYTPNNASLVIAGDFDPSAARALVEKYFGTLKRGEPVPPVTAKMPPIEAERRRIVTDQVELPRVYMGWVTPPFFEPGDSEADITAAVLAQGQASRLYRKLVYELQVAQDVSAHQGSRQLGSQFVISATASPGRTAGEVERAIDVELAALRAAPPSVGEVEGARNRMETAIVAGLERLGGVADLLNRYNHYLGTPGYLPKDIARVRAVEPEAVQAFVRQYLRSDARAVIHVVPGPKELGAPVPTPAAPASSTADEGVTSVNVDQLWREQMPGALASQPLRLAVPVSARLPNGLTLILAERPGLPVVSAQLVVKTGSDANPLDRPGLASFAADMLDQGTATRSALQIASEVSEIGASLSAAATMDATYVSTRSLKRNFSRALDLLADVALRPSFPAQEIERQRSLRLGRLTQQRKNAQALALETLAGALYGPAHPYGFTDLGNETGVKATTREDLESLWRRGFTPGNAALVVAGDISMPELTVLATKTLGAWTGAAVDRVAVATPPETARRIVVVDMPGAPQTQLYVATVAATRSTPDYQVLRVLNEVLGGLFSSRINMNLRERNGYTYGARSRFAFRRGAGPFSVSAGVRTDVTAPAVSEIFREIERMRNEPMSPDELRMAKEALTQSLPGAFGTTSGAVSNYGDAYLYGLGLDYFLRYPPLVNAVTAAQALDAAKRYLKPEQLVVVAVGDRARIEPELRKLNIGPVRVLP